MRTWKTSVSLVCVTLASISCASWQAKYLKAAANHATMTEVENHLGRPHATWDLQTGETLWTYQSGMPSGTGLGGITIVGPGWVLGKRSDCTEYVLLFDHQKILGAWMQQPCEDSRFTIWRGRSKTSELPPKSSATGVACVRHLPVAGASRLDRGS
jgi:hypothetical protein